MSTLTKSRSALRRSFTNQAKTLDEQLKNVVVETQQLKSSWELLNITNERVKELDSKIFQELVTDDAEDTKIDEELESALQYQKRWQDLKILIGDKLSEKTKTGSGGKNQSTKIKYPKIEVVQFDGELKNWLPFWAQFSKIDADDSIDDDDKFQLLIQAITPGSPARRLVDGYPLSAENYRKCLDHLKTRYARKDLLIQVYVRELLTLVLRKDGIELVSLFDQISAQLRSLESLGVHQESAAFIFPLVESALPINIIREWQRSGVHSHKIDEELKNLLLFLEKEVESEQRIKMAKETILTKDETEREVEPTASCLLASASTQKKGNEKEQLCLWCDKSNHSSSECFKLSRLSFEDKKRITKEKKACQSCLRKTHPTKFCKSKVKCLICLDKHTTIMCPTLDKQKDKQDGGKSETTALTTAASTSKTTLLQTVVVEIENKGKKIKTRALLDSGSQRTYIKEELTRELEMKPTKKETLTHQLFGGIQTKSQEYNVFQLKIKNLEGDFDIDMLALGQNSICNSVPKIDTNNKSLLALLKQHNIELTDDNELDIGLLIGADFSGLLFTGELVQLENGLTALKTKLGWTLQGQVSTQYVKNFNIVSLFCKIDSVDLTDYWSLETLGIRDPAELKSKTEVEVEVMSFFKDNISVNEEGRYEVKLPFKSGYEDLLPNYERAKQRLESMTKKLIITGKYTGYDGVFQEWLKLGIIETVPLDEEEGHFLPHRAVIKESSLTSAIRPVFDASAKDKNGLSVNACLEKGVNLIDLIPNLLIGFRTGAIGIVSDIEKAFLQISLLPEDRKYLKFLWWEDQSMQKMIVYRHCRVVFGLTSSPFLLSATLKHHLEQVTGKYQETANILSKTFYVDNCITSLDTVDEQNKFIKEAKSIMMEGKFNLRMWVTSGPDPVNEPSKEVISVLGLSWNTVSDELHCNLKSLPAYDDLGSITKRDLLSLTQRVFDPIGYTAPALLTPKLIIQETWRRDISWDSILPTDLLSKFNDWYKYITYFNECRVPRRLTVNDMKSCELSLHLFCDASKDGYGAGVFMRAEKEKFVSVQLIVAKSRVSPPKQMSIPRLELTAALIGSRLISNLRDNSTIPKCREYCWTDAGVILSWIKKELPLNNFVGNRVKEIRTNTQVTDWYHVPGEYNWADIASRGCNAKELVECRWWEGPPWLKFPSHQWPRSEIEANECEILKETKKTVTCNNNVCYSDSLLCCLEKYFAKYTKIIRTTAWIFRFLHNTRHTSQKKFGEITFKEYESAEKSLLRLTQNTHGEIMTEKCCNLTQFQDNDGLIRVKTKLLLSGFPEAVRTPYLLPGKSVLVKKMVRQRHVQLQHAGTNQLIADIRTRFWIIGIRRLVKTIISQCIVCTRYRAKPVQAPTAPLPPERTTCSAAFQTTGVDLAGPLHLKGGEKCWIVLYTCAVYRAVHLELTRSLSTEAFMMTMRRFIARRGRLSIMISDNGTNFVGTKNLFSSLNWEDVIQHSSIRRIEWKMNVPTASWWGGFFERLIGILKALLRRILGQSNVTYDELFTLICECEATMNARPLTYLSDDKGDNLEPLTPAYFIQPIPISDVSDLDQISGKSLNYRLKYVQSLRDQFHQRFMAEYLTLLVQRGKEKNDSLKVGDIVLIETEEKKLKWPLGKVTSIIPGLDGVGRTARVQTKIGPKIRPVQRLYKMELTAEESSSVPSGFPTETAELVTKPSGSKNVTTRSGRVVRRPSRLGI